MGEKEAKKWYNSVRSFLSFRDVRNVFIRRLTHSVLLQNNSALAGFTLIEIIIVVAIAAVLVTVFMLFGNPLLQSAKAKDAQRISDIKQLKAALDLYYDDHKCYPDAIPADSWIENNVVYMIKVPKDPDIGTEANSGYLYQVDKTDTCPQWNVLYTKYTSRQFKVDDCPLSAMTACNYTGNMACSLSGQVDCNYISSNPVVPPGGSPSNCPANSPKIYVKDGSGKCNVAPNNQGEFCIEECSQ